MHFFGNFLEICKMETLSSKNRARTQEKGARIDRLSETEVSRLARESGPDGSRWHF